MVGLSGKVCIAGHIVHLSVSSMGTPGTSYFDPQFKSWPTEPRIWEIKQKNGFLLWKIKNDRHNLYSSYSWMLWVILSSAIWRFPIACLARKNHIVVGYVFFFFPTHTVYFWLKADLSQLKQPTQQFGSHTEPTASRELEGWPLYIETTHSVVARENTWLVNSHTGAEG